MCSSVLFFWIYYWSIVDIQNICFEYLPSNGPGLGHCDFTSLDLKKQNWFNFSCVLTLSFKGLADFMWKCLSLHIGPSSSLIGECSCLLYCLSVLVQGLHSDYNGSSAHWTSFLRSRRVRGYSSTWEKVNGRNHFWLKPSIPTVSASGLPHLLGRERRGNHQLVSDKLICRQRQFIHNALPVVPRNHHKDQKALFP